MELDDFSSKSEAELGIFLFIILAPRELVCLLGRDIYITNFQLKLIYWEKTKMLFLLIQKGHTIISLAQ